MTGKKLAWGYTTGTCAQAATKAAAEMLFSQVHMDQVEVTIPNGETARFPVEEIRFEKKDGSLLSVSCGIKKDSGDDPDITDGVLVKSRVERIRQGVCLVEGGEGVGRVTGPGLDQPVGAAAINRVPREMIRRELILAARKAGYDGGLKAVIQIPGGEELAKKTFNPRLGIQGGLSILGTSGRVEPMSEQALLDTIRLEMQVKYAKGHRFLLLSPGNYGLDFLKREYNIDEKEVVKCSNFIGASIDMAAGMGVQGFVLAGHIGKLIKVSGGIMNTHSKEADCRMELLAAAALKAGLSWQKARAFLDCLTTDDALEQCDGQERGRLMDVVMTQIEKYLQCRAPEQLQVGAIVFSNVYGMLGKTRQAESLLKKVRDEKS
nr:cobalt-precorrin-5B (C(1))-methyltransferase CbiD [uncultured Merdimonas sp.]